MERAVVSFHIRDFSYIIVKYGLKGRFSLDVFKQIMKK